MVLLCSCGGLIRENRVHDCCATRCSCGGLQFEGMVHCCGYKPDYSKPPTDYEVWKGFRSFDEWLGSPNWGKQSPSLFTPKNPEARILNSASSMEEIRNLQQTGSFQDYCNSFDFILTKVILSEEYATSLFVGGLKSEIRDWVRFLRPKTLGEAYEKAKNQYNFLTICFANKEVKKVRGQSLSLNSDEEFSKGEIKTIEESESLSDLQEANNQELIDCDDSKLTEDEIKNHHNHNMDFCKDANETDTPSQVEFVDQEIIRDYAPLFLPTAIEDQEKTEIKTVSVEGPVISKHKSYVEEVMNSLLNARSKLDGLKDILGTTDKVSQTFIKENVVPEIDNEKGNDFTYLLKERTIGICKSLDGEMVEIKKEYDVSQEHEIETSINILVVIMASKEKVTSTAFGHSVFLIMEFLVNRNARSSKEFLYDLSSSLKTFINKIQVRKKAYDKLHIGDIFKFVFTYRLYGFQAPPDLLTAKEIEYALKLLDNIFKRFRNELNTFEFVRVEMCEWKLGWQDALKMGFLFKASLLLLLSWVFITHIADMVILGGLNGNMGYESKHLNQIKMRNVSFYLVILNDDDMNGNYKMVFHRVIKEYQLSFKFWKVLVILVACWLLLYNWNSDVRLMIIRFNLDQWVIFKVDIQAGNNFRVAKIKACHCEKVHPITKSAGTPNMCKNFGITGNVCMVSSDHKMPELFMSILEILYIVKIRMQWLLEEKERYRIVIGSGGHYHSMLKWAIKGQSKFLHTDIAQAVQDPFSDLEKFNCARSKNIFKGRDMVHLWHRWKSKVSDGDKLILEE